MTKQQHIHYWAKQIDDDLDCATAIFFAGHYAQSLFWAHLCLEKMCKALWIKNNDGNTPPFVHNLLKIATQTKEFFTEEQLQFFADMNTFQIRGRYPDYAHSFENTIDKKTAEKYLNQTKKTIECLQQMLQK